MTWFGAPALSLDARLRRSSAGIERCGGQAMAKTPWEMAEVGSEFSHQTALFAWAAMARLFGPAIANQAESYAIAGYAKQAFERAYVLKGENVNGIIPIVELKWLHAIKNQGHGDKVRGARSNAEGLVLD